MHFTVDYITQLSDEELFALFVSSSNRVANEELFERYYADLIRYTYVRVGEFYMAEYIVQEVLMDIWRRRKSIVVPKKVKAYFLKAVKYKIADKTSSKFKVISPYSESDPEKGIVYNNSLLDRVLEIESDEGLFDGHKVLGEFSAYIGSTGLLNSKVFTIKGNTIHLSEFNTEYEAPYVPTLRYLGSETIDGLHEDSPIAIFEDTFGDAYVASHNSIYKSSISSLGFGKYLDIDPSLGEITALKYMATSINSSQPRLFVTTYDENSAEELKGSVLIYDVNSKKVIHEFKNVTNRVVDIFLGE